MKSIYLAGLAISLSTTTATLAADINLDCIFTRSDRTSYARKFRIDAQSNRGEQMDMQAGTTTPMNVVWDGANAIITEVLDPAKAIVVYFTRVNILTGDAVSGFDTKAGWKRMRTRNPGKCNVQKDP